MSSGAILEGKKAVVSEIAGKMKEAESFVVVDYKGIDVEQDTNLRKKAREAGVDYKIYKNTFLRFAAKECGYDELADIFKDSSAIAFSNEDVVAPAKVISEFAKENELDILAFKGGVIDGEVASLEDITAISKLPSKEVLLGKMVGSLNAPITNFALVINAIKDKFEQEGGAEEASAEAVEAKAEEPKEEKPQEKKETAEEKTDDSKKEESKE